MKKKIILTAAILYMALINTSARGSLQANSGKKNYMNLVKIETNTGETFEAALSRRTPDTVYVSLLEKDYVTAGGKRIKVLSDEGETGIAVNQIRNYEVKIDPNIVYRDDLKKKNKATEKQKSLEDSWYRHSISVAAIAALPVIVVACMTIY